jgi:hypothetical protein
VIEALIGVALMVAPALFGYGGAAADVQRVIGPVVACLAVVGFWETTRGLRWGVLAAGAALLVAAPLAGGGSAALAGGLSAALALLVLPWLGGHTEGRYGGGWRALLGTKGAGDDGPRGGARGGDAH